MHANATSVAVQPGKLVAPMRQRSVGAAGSSILIDADAVRTSEASAGVLRNESTVAVTGSVASGRFITQK